MESSLQSWMAIKRVDLRRPLKVEFEGENTVDIHGVKREYLTMLAREIVQAKWKLFLPCTDGTYRPNPQSGV